MDRFLIKKSINPEPSQPQPVAVQASNKVVDTGKENISNNVPPPVVDIKQNVSSKSNDSKLKSGDKKDTKEKKEKEKEKKTTKSKSEKSSDDKKKQTKNNSSSSVDSVVALAKKDGEVSGQPVDAGLKQTCVSSFFRPVAAGDAPVWKYLFEKEAAERAERERLEREQREKEEEELRVKREEEKKKRAELKKQRDKERRKREEEEWMEYKMAMEARNKGFEIIPHLYLGSFAAAKNKEWLTENNITKIINVTSEVKCYFAPKTSAVNEGSDIDSNGEEEEEEEGEEKEVKEQPLKIDYFRVPIADSSKAPIEEYFENSIQFIDNAIKAGQNVFVHCQQGRSRSPSIIIVYLMKQLGWTLEKAWIHVSKLNPRSLTVNDGFRKKLINFEFSIFKSNSNLDFFLDDHKEEVATDRSSRNKNRRITHKPVENDKDCIEEDLEDDDDDEDDEEDDEDIDITPAEAEVTVTPTTIATNIETNNHEEDDELMSNLNLEDLKVVKRRRGNVIED